MSTFLLFILLTLHLSYGQLSSCKLSSGHALGRVDPVGIGDHPVGIGEHVFPLSGGIEALVVGHVGYIEQAPVDKLGPVARNKLLHLSGRIDDLVVGPVGYSIVNLVVVLTNLLALQQHKTIIANIIGWRMVKFQTNQSSVKQTCPLSVSLPLPHYETNTTVDRYPLKSIVLDDC